jgi:hypothetical protein
MMETGSVLKFKLPCDLGFGYARLIDFTSISKIDGTIIKVYDYYGHETKDDIEEICKHDYLLNAIPLVRVPNLKGKDCWKLLGVKPMDDDNDLPDFKYKIHVPVMDESTLDPNWKVSLNFGTTKDDSFYPYSKVRHLEQRIFSTRLTIETRSAIEILRKKNENIGDYFDIESEKKVVYYRSINIPIFSTIPKEIRGKALIQGRVPNEFLNYWETNK